MCLVLLEYVAGAARQAVLLSCPVASRQRHPITLKMSMMSFMSDPPLYILHVILQAVSSGFKRKAIPIKNHDVQSLWRSCIDLLARYHSFSLVSGMYGAELLQHVIA